MLDTAERAGFEPATDLSARTRFPVALLRPLGHLSEWDRVGERPRRRLELVAVVVARAGTRRSDLFLPAPACNHLEVLWELLDLVAQGARYGGFHELNI